MRSRRGAGRTFLLVAAFATVALAGTWLGAVAAVTTGMALSGPARFPGEDLAAALAAALGLAVMYASSAEQSSELRRSASFSWPPSPPWTSSVPSTSSLRGRSCVWFRRPISKPLPERT